MILNYFLYYYDYCVSSIVNVKIGEEIDDKFTKTVSRLTKRITVLQKDYEKNEIDDEEFKDKMAKIEKDVGKIDNQLGLR